MSATAFQRMRREAEAKRLADTAKSETAKKKSTEITNNELMEMLDELGVEYDKRATKTTLKALLEAAQNKTTENDPEDPDNDEGAE